MKQGFRQSMTWLHTWTGLVVGWVLYFIFVTGTVGYFYVEIDRWMRPELPLAADWPSVAESVDKAEAYLQEVAPDAGFWRINLPVGRQSRQLDVAWGKGTTIYSPASDQRVYVPASGTFEPEITARQTDGAYGLYRMHWKLHYLPQQLGVFIVGFCTMMLLVAIFTGVIAHKRIFTDFFTFRPGKGQRSWLDFHNLMGVMALPFLVMITYSGLIFYTVTYVPAGIDAAYGKDHEAYWDNLIPSVDITDAGVPAPTRPLGAFLDSARTTWNGEDPDLIVVLRPGHSTAQVVMFQTGYNTLLRDVGEKLHFSGADGALLLQDTGKNSATLGTYSTLLGLHEGIFADTLLRWMYFLSGVLGCALIGTGLVLWTTKRRARMAEGREFGFRLVECLNIGTIVGLPVAIAAYLWANRFLSADFAGRMPWEFHVMFITWGAMLVYPTVRPPGRAWVEELWMAAGISGLLPLVNALTSDRHLGVTIPAGDWELAGVDLTAFGFSICFAVAAVVVGRRVDGAAPEPVVSRTALSAAAE